MFKSSSFHSDRSEIEVPGKKNLSKKRGCHQNHAGGKPGGTQGVKTTVCKSAPPSGGSTAKGEDSLDCREGLSLTLCTKQARPHQEPGWPRKGRYKELA